MTMKKHNRPEPVWIRLRKNRFFVVGVISLVFLCGLAGLAFARYMHSAHSGVAARAKEFYFTSNLLDGETHTLAPGSDSVTFTLGNHADELRYSEVNIEYKVTVKNANTDTEITIASGSNASGKLNMDEKSDQKVTLSLEPGTYIVTATGTGEGYTKELTATIVVPAVNPEIYYYPDESAGEYILLTVWNEGDVSGDISITYTGIPDNTNPNMTQWESGSESAPKTVEITGLEPHTSKVFRFFGGTATASNADYKKPN